MKVTIEQILSLHLIYALKMYSIKNYERKKVFHDIDFYFLNRARVKQFQLPPQSQTASEKSEEKKTSNNSHQKREKNKTNKKYTKYSIKQNSGKIKKNISGCLKN